MKKTIMIIMVVMAFYLNAYAGPWENGSSIDASTVLPDGVTATSQSQGDNSTKVATTAYVDTGLGGRLASSSGLASALPGTCTPPSTYYATDTETHYLCSGTTWYGYYKVSSDGSYGSGVKRNTSAMACPSGLDCIGSIGGNPYFNTDGTAGASAVRIATLTGTETFTNKTLTAPIATLARVDGHTAISPLTAAQVSGTVIRNTGQALADVNHTLPQAAAGYNFIAYVGTTLAATNYWRFTADASPQDYMCLDGTCGKTYVSVDTPTMGDTLTCYTEQMSGTGLKNEADLGIGTSANTSVKNTVAVEFDIAGTGYSKAIAETAPGNDTIPQNKYGAVAFEIGADGTIDAIEASANATGYDSAALAIAGIPAVAASHTRLGTVTAMSTEAGGFVFGTTALNAANTTVAYTDATVYTPSFGWVCITGKGTWSTD